MSATTVPADQRIVTLDVLRGVAVMGILVMNIIAFSMPFQAYFNPTAYGGDTGADLWAWILSFIFVDGKMRAMFSMLFGASMLLVIDRAGAGGRGGWGVHSRRMFWLLVFGLAHFFLIWFGDILVSYALTGFIAFLFVARTQRQLMKWALIFFGVGALLFALAFFSPLALEARATSPGADPAVVQRWLALKQDLGWPSQAVIAEELARYRGNWLGIVQYQVSDRWYFPVQGLVLFGPETLALMLLGMWGLRSGFLTGEWEARRYRKVALVCLGISIPVYALLAWMIVRSGFQPGLSIALTNGIPVFFRPVMMVGYAAVVVLAVKRGAEGQLGSRVAAAGRAAFTNYLGTSIIATFIFYGWGLGLYGELSRAESYIIVAGICAVMLLWSKPWLERYQYGPLEWLWRSLAKGRPQPMRRLPPPDRAAV
jgi:uncharacterized protein